MKKFLLLGAAAMMALAVNAESTIEKVWSVPADAATGFCSSRTVNGFGDVIFGANNGAGTIEEWKDGVLVKSYDVNTFCATNQLGEEVDQKDEAGNVTGKTFAAYTLWTAVMVDDAGNVLANVGLGAGSATTCQNWVLLPASDRTAMQLLHIDEFPSAGVTLGRVDVPATLVVDITGDGAYLHIPATNSSIMPVMYIGLDDEGKIYFDTESSWGLLSATTFDSSSNVGSFQTVDDILAATTEEEVAAKTYVRWRGQGAPFTWNAETSQFEKNITINQGAGTAGMGVFEIQGNQFMVVPVTSATNGTRGASVAVYNLETNTESASWDSEGATDYYVGSVTARANEDGTAYIYVGGHKDCIALLKFTPDLSAIESIAADNAAVEYFNLQGVKVAKAENGLFIKKQGNKVSKVVL